MKILLVLLAMFLISFNLDAQVTGETNLKPVNEKPEPVRGSVKKIGHYFSAGIGRGLFNNLPDKIADMTIFGFMPSYSLAYKSHVATFTRAVSTTSVTGFNEHDSHYSHVYNALLLGEAIRKKHFFGSINIGVAHSNMSFQNAIDMHNIEQYHHKGLSFPIELKLFLLTRNGIGIGLHVYENFEAKYSTSFITLSIVLGHWNN